MKPLSKKADDLRALGEDDEATGQGRPRLAVQGDRAKHIGRARAKKASRALPEFVEPMKAKLVAVAPPESGPARSNSTAGAPGPQGRSQARLVSRNRRGLRQQVPRGDGIPRSHRREDAIIDGEIVALDDKGRSSFQLLQAYDIEAGAPADFLRLRPSSTEWQGPPQAPAERKEGASGGSDPDKPGVIRFSAGLSGEAESLLHQARKLGLEGLIGKKVGSLYEPGLAKRILDQAEALRRREFVIGGYTAPEGSR